MSLAQIARFRPAGPWRLGPDSGASDRVDRLLHSDSLYSAVTLAMAELGRMEEWLDATARAAEPAVRLTSAFPFHGDTLFAPPPMNHWPPAPSPRVRWKGARFVPIQAIARLLREGGLNENDWIVDAESECLIPVGKGRSGAPFRIGLRSGAAVDRMTGAVAGYGVACLEFAPGAGFWMAVSYANEQERAAWSLDVAAALRLLGDTGIGGERSRGWGRSEAVEIRDAGGVFSPFAFPAGEQAHQPCWWLLSLFSPADDERVDWTRGAFSTITRSGRARSGELKRSSRMVVEGSVVMSEAPLRGVARNVAPAAAQHPAYRWGAAFAVPAFARAAEPAMSQNRAAEPTPESVETSADAAVTPSEIAEPTREAAEPTPQSTQTVSDAAEPNPEPTETIAETAGSTWVGTEPTAGPAETARVGTETTSEAAATTPERTETTSEAAGTPPEPPEPRPESTGTAPEAAESAPVGTETTSEAAATTPERTETTSEAAGTPPEPPELRPESTGTAPEAAQTAPIGTETTNEAAESTPAGTETTADAAEPRPDDPETRPE